MSEFENGFLFTTEFSFRGDWWIHPLALSPEKLYMFATVSSGIVAITVTVWQ
jgi:hypothetical protein